MNQPEFRELAHFQYPTHVSYVFQHCDTGVIHCLKYNNQKIDWTYYLYEEWEQCKEYMILALPQGSWGFSEE